MWLNSTFICQRSKKYFSLIANLLVMCYILQRHSLQCYKRQHFPVSLFLGFNSIPVGINLPSFWQITYCGSARAKLKLGTDILKNSWYPRRFNFRCNPLEVHFILWNPPECWASMPYHTLIPPFNAHWYSH